MRRFLCFSLLASFVVACSGKFGVRNEEPTVPFPSPRPTFGKTVTQPRSVAPISGGTLLIARDGKTAIAADPDRDRVVITDLESGTSTPIALVEGDEPGRAVEDDNRRVHVALRRGGAVVTIDLATKEITKRRALCGAPRGIAWNSASSSLFVACAGGELVTIGPDGDTPTNTVVLDRDLRDVVVTPTGLVVTSFRSAEVMQLAFDGTLR
jgi:DNA-binding beta-propeller fold protein YncE